PRADVVAVLEADPHGDLRHLGIELLRRRDTGGGEIWRFLYMDLAVEARLIIRAAGVVHGLVGVLADLAGPREAAAEILRGAHVVGRGVVLDPIHERAE